MLSGRWPLELWRGESLRFLLDSSAALGFDSPMRFQWDSRMKFECCSRDSSAIRLRVVAAGADPGGVFAGGGSGFGDHGYFEGQIEWGLG